MNEWVEVQLGRLKYRLETEQPPESSALLGSCPIPINTYAPLIQKINHVLDIAPGTERVFAQLAMLVMTTWMFPWFAKSCLNATVTHEQYSKIANTALMGSIEKVF